MMYITSYWLISVVSVMFLCMLAYLRMSSTLKLLGTAPKNFLDISFFWYYLNTEVIFSAQSVCWIKIKIWI